MPRPRKQPPNRKDGLYEVKITLGRRLDGSLVRKSFYSSISKDDARKQAERYRIKQAVAEQTGIAFIDRTAKFSDWAETWLTTYKLGKVKGNTYYSTYLGTVRNHLIPYFAAAPDFVLTVETKGIPFALMVARALGVQLVIARRDHKAFEGSVVTINYISGSGGEMKTMSLAKRAVRPGQKALIVDDFTKDGGTVRGMVELMQEFDVTTVGVGVMVERRREGAPRIYEDIRSLFIVSDAMDARQGAVVHPAPWLEVQE